MQPGERRRWYGWNSGQRSANVALVLAIAQGALALWTYRVGQVEMAMFWSMVFGQNITILLGAGTKRTAQRIRPEDFYE